MIAPGSRQAVITWSWLVQPASARCLQSIFVACFGAVLYSCRVGPMTAMMSNRLPHAGYQNHPALQPSSRGPSFPHCLSPPIEVYALPRADPVCGSRRRASTGTASGPRGITGPRHRQADAVTCGPFLADELTPVKKTQGMALSRRGPTATVHPQIGDRWTSGPRRWIEFRQQNYIKYPNPGSIHSRGFR